VGNEKLVTLLLDNNADVNIENAFGWPPIIEACRNGHYEVVETLLTRNPQSVQHKDKDGETPIEHSNHPWIRALLWDTEIGSASASRTLLEVLDVLMRLILFMLVGLGVDGRRAMPGPRAQLSQLIKDLQPTNLQQRIQDVTEKITELRDTFRYSCWPWHLRQPSI